VGIVVVKFKSAIAMVVKRIEIGAGRRSTFGTGVAISLVVLLLQKDGGSYCVRVVAAVTVGLWLPRASHKVFAAFTIAALSCGYLCLLRLPHGRR
jgi:hypothetical protein